MNAAACGRLWMAFSFDETATHYLPSMREWVDVRFALVKEVLFWQSLAKFRIKIFNINKENFFTVLNSFTLNVCLGVDNCFWDGRNGVDGDALTFTTLKMRVLKFARDSASILFLHSKISLFRVLVVIVSLVIKKPPDPPRRSFSKRFFSVMLRFFKFRLEFKATFALARSPDASSPPLFETADE